MSKHDVIYVVIGVGSDKKPHAARYHDRDGAVVARAAGLMGYKIASAVNAKAKTIAKTLPEIKLFASGRALVPRVKQSVFDYLNEALTFPTLRNGKDPNALSQSAADVTEQTEDLNGLLPNPWASIKVGSIVLAVDSDVEGWFEAVVVNLSLKGAMLGLRWRDYPRLQQFKAPRTAVAIPPSARPAVVGSNDPRLEAMTEPGEVQFSSSTQS